MPGTHTVTSCEIPTLFNPSAPAATSGASDEFVTRPLSVRSVALPLFLAALFGYCIPIVDFKTSNTFLGAMHMPAGAIAVLLALLLVVNPLLRLLSDKLAFTRGKTLITKFGGSDSYRKAIPLFLGLALGDIMIVVFWICVDGWQGWMHTRCYRFKLRVNSPRRQIFTRITALFK